MPDVMAPDHDIRPAADDPTKNTFGIALALSGAVSAGAYSAGVLDFLVQALQEWEQERGKDTIPGHSTCITVIAGASAGAITGALGVVALARGLRPVKFDKPAAGQQMVKCVLPTLYEAWVTEPRMTAPGGLPSLLSVEDLLPSRDMPASPVEVQSLLNARLLDSIKAHGLAAPAGPAATPPRFSFIADCIHVLMTVSNLRGIPFDIKFGSSLYPMCSHGDRVHYAITGVGSSPYPASEWAKKDRYDELDASTLPGPGSTLSEEWDAYGEAALASAAFPVGLAPRKIKVPFEKYQRRQYPFDVRINCGINPNFPAAAQVSADFKFLNVDGGLINNNPFDYALYALCGQPAPGDIVMGPVVAPDRNGILETTKRDGKRADRAVIMVSPFPQPPIFPAEGQPAPELLKVARALLPALINQARFRASELAPAIDQRDYSRFLVVPRRELPGAVQPERFPIASGLLGGFGGFLDESFRAHDFQLGRRNCQQFLRTAFALPVDDGQISGNSLVSGTHPSFHIAPDPKQLRTQIHSPIIPLIGDAKLEVVLPPWPQMTQLAFKDLVAQIRTRLAKVGPCFFAAQTTSRKLRALALVLWWFSSGQVMGFIRDTILADLVRRNQIRAGRQAGNSPTGPPSLTSLPTT